MDKSRQETRHSSTPTDSRFLSLLYAGTGRQKARSEEESDRAGKARTAMSFTVRTANGKTSIRFQLGLLAITVEFPL